MNYLTEKEKHEMNIFDLGFKYSKDNEGLSPCDYLDKYRPKDGVLCKYCKHEEINKHSNPCFDCVDVHSNYNNFENKD